MRHVILILLVLVALPAFAESGNCQKVAQQAALSLDRINHQRTKKLQMNLEGQPDHVETYVSADQRYTVIAVAGAGGSEGCLVESVSFNPNP